MSAVITRIWSGLGHNTICSVLPLILIITCCLRVHFYLPCTHTMANACKHANKTKLIKALMSQLMPSSCVGHHVSWKKLQGTWNPDSVALAQMNTWSYFHHASVQSLNYNTNVQASVDVRIWTISLPLHRVRCKCSNLWTRGRGLSAGQTAKETRFEEISGWLFSS